MKKTLFTALAMIMLVGVAIVMPLSSANAVETFLAETETRIYKPDKSFGGYFIPSQNTSGNTIFLLDMWGRLIHKWDRAAGYCKPEITETGQLWAGGSIQDWDGNLLWEFVPTRDAPNHLAFTIHHDFKRIWNKKLKQWTQLVNCNRNRTVAEAINAGGDPATPTSRLTGLDFIAEIDMNKNIVWEWDFLDHTCQSQFPTRNRYIADVKDAPGKFDVYWMTDNQRPNGQAGFVADWAHVNSIDYDETLDHVVINPKHFSTFVVVDHGNTFVSTTNWASNIAAAAGSKGDIIYRWGNPSMYNAGKAPGWQTEGDSQMYGSHNIQFIRPYHWYEPHTGDNWPSPAAPPYGYTKASMALPGAGNFLIFDNGCYNPTGKRSRVLEINPTIGTSGSQEVPRGQYIDPAVAGYKTNPANLVYHQSRQLVYSYASSSQHSFYSSHISGCQRLPNGNTSVMSGNQGHMFEVMPSGEIVWEYLYPASTVGFGASATLVMKTMASDSNNAWNVDSPTTKGGLSSYRHLRYGVDFPGFVGRDMTPGQTLTGLAPRLVGEGRTAEVSQFGFGFGGSWGEGGGGGAAGGSGGGSGY